MSKNNHYIRLGSPAIPGKPYRRLIGVYSLEVSVDATVYFSGSIPMLISLMLWRSNACRLPNLQQNYFSR